MPTSISERLRFRASQEGFSSIRIASAEAGARAGRTIAQLPWASLSWRHGLACRNGGAPRQSQSYVARSAIGHRVCHELWAGPRRLAKGWTRKSQGVISVYALNRDYHDVVKGKLKNIATWFASDGQGGGEGFCRYGAADGEAAGPRRRPWLAGQAHQSRCRANWAHGSSSARY